MCRLLPKSRKKLEVVEKALLRRCENAAGSKLEAINWIVLSIATDENDLKHRFRPDDRRKFRRLVHLRSLRQYAEGAFVPNAATIFRYRRIANFSTEHIRSPKFEKYESLSMITEIQKNRKQKRNCDFTREPRKKLNLRLDYSVCATVDKV